MLCLLIPTSLLDPYSLQVILHQISPSSSWTSLGPCMRKPAKQGDLWGSLRGHPVRWPSHSRRSLMSLVVMVSLSPHCSLIILKKMCSSHCCVQVIPKMVRIQRWWKVFSHFWCFFKGIQHSPPYSNTDNTQA